MFSSYSSFGTSKELRSAEKRKAARGIVSGLLTSCADQLCRTVKHIFKLKLKLGSPHRNTFYEVPKSKGLNSLRPVAQVGAIRGKTPLHTMTPEEVGLSGSLQGTVLPPFPCNSANHHQKFYGNSSDCQRHRSCGTGSSED